MDKETKKYLAALAKDQKELDKFVETLKAPDGFIMSWQTDSFWYDGETRPSRNFVLRNEALKVAFIFRPGGGGRTEFEVEGKGILSFDRRGVSDSFYWKRSLFLAKKDKVSPYEDMALIFEEQLERITKRREYYKSALAVPGLPFTVAPDAPARIKEEILKRGSYSFTPSDFGTGYMLSKRARFFYAKRANPELEEFIGLAPLWISTIDCD